LVKKYDSHVFVARPPEPLEMVETEAMFENSKDHFKNGFAALRTETESAKIKAHFSVTIGSPADQIIHYANEEKADLIVLRHRGKSRVIQWLLGSASRRVTSYASCSVLIVR
jgi:nucleotide-binding universal stress UspA family protein